MNIYINVLCLQGIYKTVYVLKVPSGQCTEDSKRNIAENNVDRWTKIFDSTAERNGSITE